MSTPHTLHPSTEIHPIKFMGLTKTQFLGVLMTLLVTLAAADGYLLLRNGHLAEQGAQSHAALCVLKKDYASRVADDRAYLKLSPAERVAKFGPALGSTPAAIVLQSERNLSANLKALSSLDCT